MCVGGIEKEMMMAECAVTDRRWQRGWQRGCGSLGFLYAVCRGIRREREIKKRAGFRVLLIEA